MSGGSTELHKGLKQRHLTMIAIGGVIGAGLFVGSGLVIKNTGPAAFLSYALTGVLIVMVMRMLGEMATANPSTGSFADYARRALGGWAGFSVGWLYWYFWVIVVGFEAVAGAKIITFWFDAPLWLLSLGLMILMTVTNLFSVRSYGEFEYWFAGIKVFAIIAFLVLGTLFVLGLWPDKELDFSNLTNDGGLFPLGVGAIFSSIVVVVFSMVGAEIATIAAAESDDPERAIAKATNSVVIRIAIFYVGSIFLLAVHHPVEQQRGGRAALRAGLPGDGHPVRRPHHERGRADRRAVLPELGALHRVPDAVRAGRPPGGPGPADHREQPRRADLGHPVLHGGRLPVRDRRLHLPGHRVPVPAQLVRRDHPVRLPADRGLPGGAAPPHRRRTSCVVKMWLFPVLSLLTIAAIVGVLISMGVNEDTRSQLVLSLISWAVVLGLYFVTQRMGGSVSAEDMDAQPPTGPATKVLVLANETVTAPELLGELRRIDADGKAEYFVCVPANPVDTGQAEKTGAAFVWEATVEAAQRRLDETLATLASNGLRAEGALGDYRPLTALTEAARQFGPDRIVISTHNPEHSAWLGQDLVTQGPRTSSTCR